MYTFAEKTGTAVGTLTCLVPQSGIAPGLGQAIGPETAASVAYQAALAQRKAEEDIKTAKTHRMWMIVSALVGVGGLVVAVISLRKKS